MANYLREQTVGDVLHNAAEIYGRNFGVIFLTYFLPVFPIGIWQTEAQEAGATGSVLVAFFCSMVTSLIAWGAMTIAVSDICLGNAPSVVRSYQKVLSGMLGRLLVASLLQLLCILVGFVLLIVPGVIAMLWLMFTPSVVVLEGLGAVAGLKRSKKPAEGFNGRNFGVLVLQVIIWAVVSGILVVLLGLFVSPLVFRIGWVAVQSLILPFLFIGVILLYYDLRVRKEAYDAAALAEDLRR